MNTKIKTILQMVIISGLVDIPVIIVTDDELPSSHINHLEKLKCKRFIEGTNVFEGTISRFQIEKLDNLEWIVGLYSPEDGTPFGLTLITNDPINNQQKNFLKKLGFNETNNSEFDHPLLSGDIENLLRDLKSFACIKSMQRHEPVPVN